MKQRILLVNDYIGHGMGTTNVLQPLLTAFGYPVSALLTAVMSHTFSYGDYEYLPLTDWMEKTLAKWERQKFHFDVVVTGFIDSLEDFRQFALLRTHLPRWKADGSFILVDPVMGDGGMLYPTLPTQLVEEMRTLVACADMITPNLTEAALLLNRSMPTDLTGIGSWLDELAEMGPQAVVITDVSLPGAGTGDIWYRTSTGEKGRVPFTRRAADFSGSGDYFNSLMLAAMLAGERLPQAVERAARFIEDALEISLAENRDLRQGLAGECLLAREVGRLLTKRPIE